LDSSKEEDRDPAKWDRLFAKWRAEGYSAIEACIGPFNPFAGQATELRTLLQRHGLELIAQAS
jgi:sugar phosphate isomerase/epimerase